MIKTKEQYNTVSKRVESLLELVTDDMPDSSPELIELDLLSSLMEHYEEANTPVTAPRLPDVIRLRMYEKGITQVELSKLLGISNSRVSEYLTGKAEPTLNIARKISKTLQIEPEIVLGL